MIKYLLPILFFFVPLHSLEIFTEQGELVPAARGILEMYQISPEQAEECFIQADKERWEFSSQNSPDPEKLQELFVELGCIERVAATKMHYDYVLILGALESRMRLRVEHLFWEWQRGVRFDTIVLLSGARDLNPDLEKFPEGMQSELELLRYILDTHPLKPLIRDIPIIEIDAPKIPPKMRPTTISTTFEWFITWPIPGSCLAISNQPYVGYQEAVLRKILPFEIEAVGPETSTMPPTSILLDTFGKWVTLSL